jgi:broad specificity phosphatase PhoE
MGAVPIYVWEHFPSADNKNRLVARADQPMLPEMMQERKMKFQRLQDEDPLFMGKLLQVFRMFKGIYCPSTPRHFESAALVCELFKLPPPVRDGRLNAIDYGDFKGKPQSSMGPPHEYIDVPYPGGESWRDCLARWRSFFDEVLTTYDGQPVLLLGQARAAIRMCAHLCDGWNLSDAVDLELTDPKVPWVYFYQF